MTMNNTLLNLETLNIELKSFFRASNGERSLKENELNLYVKKRSIIVYRMNLKLKLPNSKLKTIGANVRISMINKKKDKTFIMDILSK